MSNFSFSTRIEGNLAVANPVLVAVVYRALALSPVDFVIIEDLLTREQQKQRVVVGVSQTMNSLHLTSHIINLMSIGANWQGYICWLPVQAGEEWGARLQYGIIWTEIPEDMSANILDAPHVEISP